MHELVCDGLGFVAGRWPLDPDLYTLVFIHGSGGSSILWHRQVTALADKMNTVAVDLPGHGRNDGPGMSRISDYSAAISRFINALDAPRPVVCGLSIGGAIVLDLLLNHKGVCHAGIVVNSGAKLKVMPLIFETIKNDYPGFVNSLYGFGISEKTDPAALTPLVDGMLQCPPDVTYGDFAACDSFDVMEQLHTIDVPVLVMTATDDKLTPAKYGNFLADTIPGASIVSIQDAGHLSPIEKPEAVGAAIENFVLSLKD